MSDLILQYEKIIIPIIGSCILYIIYMIYIIYNIYIIHILYIYIYTIYTVFFSKQYFSKQRQAKISKYALNE